MESVQHIFPMSQKRFRGRGQVPVLLPPLTAIISLKIVDSVASKADEPNGQGRLRYMGKDSDVVINQPIHAQYARYASR